MKHKLTRFASDPLTVIVVTFGLCVGLLALLGGCQLTRGADIAIDGGAATLGAGIEVTNPPVVERDPLAKERDISACGGLHEKGSPEHCGCLRRHGASGDHEYTAYCEQEAAKAPVGASAGVCAADCPVAPPAQDALGRAQEALADAVERGDDFKRERDRLQRLIDVDYANDINRLANRAADAEAALDVVREGCPRVTGKDGYHAPDTTTHVCDCQAVAMLLPDVPPPIHCEDAT